MQLTDGAGYEVEFVDQRVGCFIRALDRLPLFLVSQLNDLNRTIFVVVIDEVLTTNTNIFPFFILDGQV